MIWNAIKFITLSYMIGWAVFLVLGAFGIRAEETAGQVVRYTLWVVLVLAAYRFLGSKRAARRP